MARFLQCYLYGWRKLGSIFDLLKIAGVETNGRVRSSSEEEGDNEADNDISLLNSNFESPFWLRFDGFDGPGQQQGLSDSPQKKYPGPSRVGLTVGPVGAQMSSF